MLVVAVAVETVDRVVNPSTAGDKRPLSCIYCIRGLGLGLGLDGVRGLRVVASASELYVRTRLLWFTVSHAYLE